MYRDDLAADYRTAERKAWQALAEVHADFAAQYEAMQADALADEHHASGLGAAASSPPSLSQSRNGRW